MRSTLMFRLGYVAAVAVILSLPAAAEIIGTGGDVVLIDPPPSVQLGDFESSTQVFAFNEVQGFRLPADVTVDASEVGVYANPDDLTPDTVPAAMVVDSHLLHFDRIALIVEGRVTGDHEQI